VTIIPTRVSETVPMRFLTIRCSVLNPFCAARCRRLFSTSCTLQTLHFASAPFWSATYEWICGLEIPISFDSYPPRRLSEIVPPSGIAWLRLRASFRRSKYFDNEGHALFHKPRQRQLRKGRKMNRPKNLSSHLDLQSLQVSK
jgi:hypothetical protein